MAASVGWHGPVPSTCALRYRRNGLIFLQWQAGACARHPFEERMKPSITLGRLFGVAIGLHYSWFIIALLITLSLVGQFGATDPDWSRGDRLGLGDHHRRALLRLDCAPRAVSRAGGTRPRRLRAFDHVVRARWRRHDGEPGAGRQNRVLDRRRRTDRQRRDWPGLLRPGRVTRLVTTSRRQPLDGGAGLVGVHQHLAGGVQSDSWLSARRRPDSAGGSLGTHGRRRPGHDERGACGAGRRIRLHSRSG